MLLGRFQHSPTGLYVSDGVVIVVDTRTGALARHVTEIETVEKTEDSNGSVIRLPAPLVTSRLTYGSLAPNGDLGILAERRDRSILTVLAGTTPSKQPQVLVSMPDVERFTFLKRGGWATLHKDEARRWVLAITRNSKTVTHVLRAAWRDVVVWLTEPIPNLIAVKIYDTHDLSEAWWYGSADAGKAIAFPALEGTVESQEGLTDDTLVLAVERSKGADKTIEFMLWRPFAEPAVLRRHEPSYGQLVNESVSMSRLPSGRLLLTGMDKNDDHAGLYVLSLDGFHSLGKDEEDLEENVVEVSFAGMWEGLTLVRKESRLVAYDDDWKVVRTFRIQDEVSANTSGFTKPASELRQFGDQLFWPGEGDILYEADGVPINTVYTDKDRLMTRCIVKTLFKGLLVDDLSSLIHRFL